MKYTLNTITAVVVVGSTLITSAVHAEDMKPKMEGGMTNSTTGSAPAPRDDAAYWTQKKLEMQQKSTEMRKQRVQELQSKWIDTSSITPDLLDASKTEEKLFWDAMKLIMQKQAEANRQKMDSDQVHVPSMRPNIDMKHDDKWAMPRNENTTKPEQSQQKPLLTEKMRNTLIKRFNAVTEDKKQTYYTRTKANLESQLEKAKTNKNTRLARKITETLYILDSVLGSTDDSADDEIINSATAQ